MLDTEEHTEETRDLSGLQVVSGGLQRYAQTVAENKWADTYEAFSNVMDNLKNQLETGGNTLLLAYSRDNFSSKARDETSVEYEDGYDASTPYAQGADNELTAMMCFDIKLNLLVETILIQRNWQ